MSIDDVIAIGDIYDNSPEGKYEIIGTENNKYKIRFLESNNEYNYDYDTIKYGKVKDKLIRKKINYDKIYNCKTGPFRVLRQVESIDGHKIVEIEFLETKAIKKVRWTDVYNDNKELSNVRDDFKPLIAGVGYIGNGSSYDPAYNLWEGIIVRCYDINSPSYKRYGALGVKVCNRWHCFENFSNDIKQLPGYDNWVKYGGMKYNFDKDLLQYGISAKDKIYSPETCMFIPVRDNSLLARQEKYNYNIDKYCGVRQISNNTYEAYITIKNFGYQNPIMKHLGVYPSAELAAAAYNNAVAFYYPNSPKINNVDIPFEVIRECRLIGRKMIKVVK